MDSNAMVPHGLALFAYSRGDRQAQLTIRREDGIEDAIPVSHFFRPPEQFFPIEVAALGRCRGRVLDIGAGTGLHSVVHPRVRRRPVRYAPDARPWHRDGRGSGWPGPVSKACPKPGPDRRPGAAALTRRAKDQGPGPPGLPRSRPTRRPIHRRDPHERSACSSSSRERPDLCVGGCIWIRRH
jgi:hypothetical protein